MRATTTALIAASVVAAVTEATRARLVPLRLLAGTPADVADGKVWLLASNAFVADNPVVLSLVAFAGFAAAAGAVCGLRTLWVSAAAGHVGSTILVYLGLAAVGAVRPAAVDRVAHLQDYGVSAIVAAWLGGLALVLWRRHPARRPRLAVVGFCALCLVVGLFADTNPTALDADHVLAFAIGIACAAAAERGYALSALGQALFTRRSLRDNRRRTRPSSSWS
jgi:hypothetical protein